MNVWLVTIGEPLPIGFGENDRLLRTGFLADLLASKDHYVTWWTSSFDHMRKKHYFENDHQLQASENFSIRLIAGPGYRKNISLSRIHDHLAIYYKFKSYIEREEIKPDIIVSSLPTIFLCKAAVSYARKNNIPVVLDMRDMWPDIFLEAAPGFCRPLLRLFLWPLFHHAYKACSGATAITGITEAFVDWGLARGRRTRSPLDRHFPLGYISLQPSEDKLNKASAYWDKLGVYCSNSDDFIVSFVGTMGQVADIETVIKAAKILLTTNRKFLFVLGGTGDKLEYYRKIAPDNVIFPGWIDAAEINTLLRRSSVGLNPLPDRHDFTSTINNKVYEYMSAGLPIIASPEKGILNNFLKQNQCGMSYSNGDAKALASILIDLSNSRQHLRQMSDNSKNIFESSFKAEKVYGDMMAYLQDVIASYKSRL